MNLLILSPTEAAALDEAPTLSPRPVVGGPEAGNYAVSPNTLTDPAQEPWWPVLTQGRIVDLDVSLAWPPSDD